MTGTRVKTGRCTEIAGGEAAAADSDNDSDDVDSNHEDNNKNNSKRKATIVLKVKYNPGSIVSAVDTGISQGR